MSRFLLSTTLLACIAAAGSAVAQSDPTPLGDYAKGVRANNPAKPARVYDNDNLSGKSATSPISDASSATPDPVKPCNSVPTDQASNTTTNTDESADIKVGQSPAERQKAYAVWKDRISQKRAQIDKLARELDDLKTNAPQSVSVLHIWPDDVKYKMMLEEKQKGLDQARTELEDLLEEARKAGVPSSFR